MTENIMSGGGTFERNGCLYSSLAGFPKVEDSADTGKVWKYDAILKCLMIVRICI